MSDLKSVITPPPAADPQSPDAVEARSEPRGFGWGVLGLYALALGGAIYTRDATLIGMVVGGIMLMGKDYTGYQYGSSRGSRAKDATIAEQGRNLAQSYPPQAGPAN